MTEDSRKPKLSDEEAASGLRLGNHLGVGLKALVIPLALSAVVLASGNYLSKLVDVDPNSILFRLWPFNHIYLRQFASSPYSSSEIKWFFTVVSCSNVVWLAFLCWKVIFELFRRDVQFPRTKSLAIQKAILLFFIAGWVLVALFGAVALAGFSTHGYDFFALAFNQSIASGATKIVIMRMTGLYVGVGWILEFGGLGLRYWLSRTFGYFVAETPVLKGGHD
jgi:hypothetical protein